MAQTYADRKQQRSSSSWANEIVSSYFETINSCDANYATLYNLMHKPSLSPEEVRQARGLTRKIEDPGIKAGFYEKIQAQVPYVNQRVSVALREDGSRYAEHDTKGGMCNMASLSMVLQSLGIPNPKPQLQYQDALQELRIELKAQKHEGIGGRLDWDSWEALAKYLGVSNIKRIETHKSPKTKEWYLKEIAPLLQSGGGAIISFRGHIVRLESISEEKGFTVDDPYGKVDPVIREKNKKGGWKDYNSKRKSRKSRTPGENNIWSWAEVEQLGFAGIIVFGGEV